jgi:hypothetical protein
VSPNASLQKKGPIAASLVGAYTAPTASGTTIDPNSGRCVLMTPENDSSCPK